MLTHDLANLDADVTDFGRLLNELRWNGVRQTARFLFNLPPPISINADEHSALGFYHDQAAANHTPGAMNIPDSYLPGEVPDDYLVTSQDQPLAFTDNTPTLQRSRASYTNKGLFTFVSDDVRVTQTAWSLPGADWLLIEYEVRNIQTTPIDDLRIGFHGYIGGRSPGLPPVIPPIDAYGPGGDGGDDIDTVLGDGSGFAYRVTDNLGAAAATTLLFRSGNPAKPLDIYHGENYTLDGGMFNPASPVFVDDEWLYDALRTNQVAYPTGSGTCSFQLVCNVRSVVGWNIGTLPPGDFVRLPLAICVGGTQAGASSSCDAARAYWQSVHSGFQITEVQDEGGARMEFYNWNKPATDITGWYFSPDGGTTRWTAGIFSCGTIAPGAHCVYTLTGAEASALLASGPEGAVIGLYDAADTRLDEIGYGQRGLAPDPLTTESTSRAYSTMAGEYSSDWSRSAAASWGSLNGVPLPDVSMRTPLNEVLFNAANPADRFIEVFYGGSATMDLANHRIVGDTAYVIPAGPPALLSPANRYYYLRPSTAPTLFAAMAVSGDNLYLYDPAGRLLDRAAWSTPHATDLSMVRLPDGSGTPGAYDDPTAVAAGWVFDQRPTYSIVSLEADATQWGHPGLYVWYPLNATNLQASPDYLDLSVLSEPMGFPAALFQSDRVTPVAATPADGDALPDTGLLAPGATYALWVRLFVQDVPMPFYYKENTSVFASSSLDPIGGDRAFLETLINPWIQPDAWADPTTIYVESAAPFGLNTIATVTVNATGRGFTRYTAQDVIFTIDSSGSMMTNDPDPNGIACVPPHPQRVDAALNYIANLSVPDRGGYVDFDSFANLVTPLTTDYATLSAQVACNDQAGGTVISFGMGEANAELANNGAYDHLKIVILLTDADGIAPADDTSCRQLANSAAGLEIIYYTIGLNVPPGPPGGVDLLTYIADTTGGAFYPAADASALDAIFADIFSRVRNLAGKDVDLTDADPMLQFVLSDQVNLVPGTFQLVPGTVETAPNPDVVITNPTNVTLQWNFSQLDVYDYWAVTFQVTAPNPGPAVPVNLVPDSRVSYLTFEDDPITRSFPLVTLNVLPPINLIAPLIESRRIGGDVVLEWSPPVGLAGANAFEVYRGPSPRGIDLTTPIALTPDTAVTSWTDVGGAALGEAYYVLRAVNLSFDVRSVTSNTAGVFTIAFSPGINAFSLPLEPFTAMDTAALLAFLGATSVQTMDAAGRWVAYPGGPSVPVSPGQGLLASFGAATTRTFSGSPGSMILLSDLPGFTAAEAQSLWATVTATGDVQLIWSAPASPAVDHYCVRRAPTRRGLHTGVSSTIGCTAPGNAAITFFLDPGAAGGAGELYYLVLPVDAAGADLSSSFSVGVWTAAYTGMHAIGLPLRPDLPREVSWYAADIPRALGVLWLSGASWIPHFTEMPPGVYDATFAQGVGYQVQVKGPTLYRFVGM